MDKYHLVQAIEEPTRRENTLDLIFTNGIEIFKQVEVNRTIMSDHDLIEITTDIEWNDEVRDEGDDRIDMEEDDLRRLNFHSERVPWPMIEKRLSKINWDKIFEGLNAEECTYIFIKYIKSMFRVNTPKKDNK